jgi:hypothetical protein
LVPRAAKVAAAAVALIIERRVTDDAGESVGFWGMSDPFFLLP